MLVRLTGSEPNWSNTEMSGYLRVSSHSFIHSRIIKLELVYAWSRQLVFTGSQQIMLWNKQNNLSDVTLKSLEKDTPQSQAVIHEVSTYFNLVMEVLFPLLAFVTSRNNQFRKLPSPLHFSFSCPRLTLAKVSSRCLLLGNKLSLLDKSF